MTLRLVIIIAFSAASICQAAEKSDWTPGDTALLVASSALIAMDWAQTAHMARNPQTYGEQNPIARVFLGQHPSPSRVNYCSAFALVGNAAVGKLLSHSYRQKWFGFWIVTEGYVVKRGYDLGIGASFRF